MQHFKFVNWWIGGLVFWCHEQAKTQTRFFSFIGHNSTKSSGWFWFLKKCGNPLASMYLILICGYINSRIVTVSGHLLSNLCKIPTRGVEIIILQTKAQFFKKFPNNSYHSMLRRIWIKGERPDQRHPQHQRLYHMGLESP